MPSPTAAEWKASEKCESFHLTYWKKEQMKKGTRQFELLSLYMQLTSFMASKSWDFQSRLLLLGHAHQTRQLVSGGSNSGCILESSNHRNKKAQDEQKGAIGK